MLVKNHFKKERLTRHSSMPSSAALVPLLTPKFSISTSYLQEKPPVFSLINENSTAQVAPRKQSSSICLFGKRKQRNPKNSSVIDENPPRRHRRSISLTNVAQIAKKQVEEEKAVFIFHQKQNSADQLMAENKQFDRSYSENELLRISEEKKRPDHMQLIAKYGLTLTHILDDDWHRCASDALTFDSLIFPNRTKLIWAENRDECFVNSHFLSNLPSSSFPLHAPISPSRSPSPLRLRSKSTSNPPSILNVPMIDNNLSSTLPSRSYSRRTSPESSLKKQGRRASLADIFAFVKTWHKRRSSNEKKYGVQNIPKLSLTTCCDCDSNCCSSAALLNQHDPMPLSLPDHIRRLGETEELPESESTDQIPDRHLQFLTDERWHRFDLFGERYNDTWHEKHRDELSKLSSKYIKKQDSIYELVNIEKQHCANLIFLQFGYRERLMREKILSNNGVNELIPDVLDALLSFHLNLLTRLVDRLQASKHVHTISDIITEEISESAKGMTRCIEAYTLFGLAKERAESNFNRLTKENSKFISFLQRCYEEPIYKRFDFKPLLAKIIGRPTKYTLILENILKNEKEFSQELDYTKTAIQATKLFAARINNSLCMSQMLSRWENIRREIDVASRTAIYITDVQKVNSVVPHEFTKEDLSLPIHTGPGTRQLRCIGDVYLKQTSEKIPLFMALFDDVLVCLYRKNGKYYFLQDQGVFPVYSLIVRVQERSHSVFLVVSGKPKLLEIEFLNRSDKDLWISALEAAINSARTEVRLTEETIDKAETRRAKGQQAAEDKWLDELDKLFRERETQETQLSNYLEGRFLFFDSLRTHMATLPFKTRADISDRVKQVVRQKFRELRLVRTTPLNKLVDRISASRDADLWSYFNDKADCAVDASDSQDSDESGAGSAEGGLRRPRRIQTFHGTIPESSTRASDRSLRRHTTVPRMHSSGMPIEDDAQEGGSWTGGYTFMHGMNEEARHATDRLAKEVVHLRREHSKLMDETAQMRIRLELLSRTRGAPSAAAPSDSMEQLRRKEQILRDKNQQLETEKKYMEEERLQLEKDRQDLERREADLTAKWEAFHQTQSQVACQVNSSIPSDGYFHSMSAASSPSPASIAMTGRMPIASSPISRNTSMREPPRTLYNSFMSPALENLKEKSETRTKRK